MEVLVNATLMWIWSWEELTREPARTVYDEALEVAQ